MIMLDTLYTCTSGLQVSFTVCLVVREDKLESCRASSCGGQLEGGENGLEIGGLVGETTALSRFWMH